MRSTQMQAGSTVLTGILQVCDGCCLLLCCLHGQSAAPTGTMLRHHQHKHPTRLHEAKPGTTWSKGVSLNRHTTLDASYLSTLTAADVLCAANAEVNLPNGAVREAAAAWAVLALVSADDARGGQQRAGGLLGVGRQALAGGDGGWDLVGLAGFVCEPGRQDGSKYRQKDRTLRVGGQEKKLHFGCSARFTALVLLQRCRPLLVTKGMVCICNTVARAVPCILQYTAVGQQ